MKRRHTVTLVIVILLLVSGIMTGVSVYLRKLERNRTEIIKTESFDEFSDAVINLVNKYDEKNIDEGELNNIFYSKRLIVQGGSDQLDFSGYGADVVICGTDNLYILQFASQEAAEKAYLEIQNLSGIKYCEMDQYMKMSSEERQPMSWGVRRLGADTYAKYVKSIADSEIIVAVVDTGVYEHPFLKGRIVQGGRDFIDNDFEPLDLHSHGTHVAGTIVDCTPGLNVKILPVRVLGEDGFGAYSLVGLGIRFAANKNSQVINLSLGGGVSQTVDNAVAYASELGCTVVIAAGNDNEDTKYYSPAHLEDGIVVSAVDDNFRKAGFSNWGDSVDFAAPGVGIVSCVPNLRDGKPEGDSVESFNGTSMAAPHIAALSAMVKLSNPSFTTDEIKNFLKDYCVDLGDPGWDPVYGWGIPDFNMMREYDAVLEAYRAAERNNFSEAVLEQSEYINLGAWNFRNMEMQVYYKCVDLANDGRPELFIALGYEGELGTVIDVFGLKNGKPVRIIENDAFIGYRGYYAPCTDGRIKLKGSGGAVNSSVTYYKLRPDSTDLYITDEYVYDGWEGNVYTHITSEDGSSVYISEDEYQRAASEADEDWTGWEPLAEYMG